MPDKTFSCKMSLGQLDNFISMLRDLNKINDKVIIRIDNENTLLYSYVGKTLSDIQAFKNYTIKTETLLDCKRDLDEPMIFIVKDTKKFIRNIINYKDFSDDVSIKFTIDSSNYVSIMSLDNKKLKIRIYGGEPDALSKDITIEDINFLMDKEKSIFSVDVNSSDFAKIKKIALIDSNNDILNMTVDNNEISIGENKWNLKIADAKVDNMSITFPKRYINAVEMNESVKIFVFDNFILIEGNNSNLIILLETKL